MSNLFPHPLRGQEREISPYALQHTVLTFQWWNSQEIWLLWKKRMHGVFGDTPVLRWGSISRHTVENIFLCFLFYCAKNSVKDVAKLLRSISNHINVEWMIERSKRTLGVRISRLRAKVLVQLTHQVTVEKIIVLCVKFLLRFVFGFGNANFKFYNNF